MARQAYKIDWNDEWIKANKNKYHLFSDFFRAYQTEVDANAKQHSFRTHCLREFNMHSSATWTEEQRKWIADNYKKFGSYFIAADMFNERFGTKRSNRALQAEMHRQGLLIDTDKLQENWSYPRRVPIGTIVDDGDGYLKIKVGKEYSSSGWVRYHRWIYEQKNGKIPKGYKIMFLDGDKQNYDVDNMVAVPASYFALMNKLNLKSEFPQVTLAGIKWCDLYSLLRKEGWILKRGEFKNIME